MTVMMLLLFLAGTATAQVSIKQLSNECSKSMSTTQLVDGKIKIVGEEMDPFCRGYLLGVYDVITAAGEVKNEAPSADYLKSVVNTYLRDNPTKNSGPAAPILRAAFRRAFPAK
jgi:hypothetical protein